MTPAGDQQVIEMTAKLPGANSLLKQLERPATVSYDLGRATESGSTLKFVRTRTRSRRSDVPEGGRRGDRGTKADTVAEESEDGHFLPDSACRRCVFFGG